MFNNKENSFYLSIGIICFFIFVISTVLFQMLISARNYSPGLGSDVFAIISLMSGTMLYLITIAFIMFLIGRGISKFLHIKVKADSNILLKATHVIIIVFYCIGMIFMTWVDSSIYPMLVGTLTLFAIIFGYLNGLYPDNDYFSIYYYEYK